MVDRVIDRSIELSHELPKPKSKRLPLWKEIEKEFEYWVVRNTNNGLAANSIGIVAFERVFCEIDFPEIHLKPKVIHNIVNHLSVYPSFREWAQDRKGFLILEDNINVRRIIMLAAGHNPQ